jgi:hypothetical protein
MTSKKGRAVAAAGLASIGKLSPQKRISFPRAVKTEIQRGTANPLGKNVCELAIQDGWIGSSNNGEYGMTGITFFNGRARGRLKVNIQALDVLYRYISRGRS